MTLLRRRSLAQLLAALLVASLLALSLGSGAGAQTAESKRAEAERIASELDQLRIQASQLDEEYAVALDRLKVAQQDILDAEARVAGLEEELGHTRTTVASYAIEAYIGGDSVATIDTVLDSDITDVGTRVAYIGVASGSKQDVLDGLAAASAQLDDELTRLDTAKAEAERLSQEAEAAREGAQAAVAEETALLATVEGELTELVAAEEAARAAATRERAEAQAREAAEESGRAAIASPPAEQADTAGPTPAPQAAAEPEPEPQAPTPAPTPPPVATPPGGAGGAVSLAYSLLGIPYVWAGSNPSTGFDCSGFTSYVWGQNGHSLPHSAAAQYAGSIHISVAELQPGDLVFYGFGYIHHVALYVGGGQIIHAPGSGRNVRIDSIYYWDQLLGTGRLR